jgi:hypothetical protein
MILSSNLRQIDEQLVQNFSKKCERATAGPQPAKADPPAKAGPGTAKAGLSRWSTTPASIRSSPCPAPPASLWPSSPFIARSLRVSWPSSSSTARSIRVPSCSTRPPQLPAATCASHRAPRPHPRVRTKQQATEPPDHCRCLPPAPPRLGPPARSCSRAHLAHSATLPTLAAPAPQVPHTAPNTDPCSRPLRPWPRSSPAHIRRSG